MKKYLELLDYVYKNGHDHSDRTGTGRRSVFGTQVRFNLNEGFPMVTTRKIPFKAVLEELLWFIRGSSDAQELSDKGVKIWDLWKVDETHIDAHIKKTFKDIDEEFNSKTELTEDDQLDIEAVKDIKLQIKDRMMEQYLGSIGPIYGAAWRNAPQHDFNIQWPRVAHEDMDPSVLVRLRKDWEEEQPKTETGQEVSFESYVFFKSTRVVDQIQNLIINLKQRPYSSRHVITSWVPEFIPFEDLSPQENVLLGKGALAPCHVLQQYFVSPPKEEGGKPRLSLLMYQRSNDLPVGAPFNIASYSLLLMMVAQVVDMEPFEFIWEVGDCHIYLNQFEGVEEQLKRIPGKLPEMKINPEVKNIFDFKSEDFQLVDYDPQESIKYLVSK